MLTNNRVESSADTCHQKVDRGKCFEQSVPKVVVAEEARQKSSEAELSGTMFSKIEIEPN